MPKLKNKIILLLLGANILIASSISIAQQSFTGSVQIEPCSINCFIYVFPSNQTVSNAINLNLTERIFFHFNYNLGNGIKVNDLREQSAWNISVNSSNLVNITDQTKNIPYTQIGILSFVNDPFLTVDNTINDSTVISLIDPTTQIPPRANKPFNQNSFDNLDPKLSTNENLFSMFTGTLQNQSNAKSIMSAPFIPNMRTSEYSIGLGLLIKIPENPHLTLTDGNYQLNLLFTITDF